ncbi:lipocalin family protein [Psychroserpens jangbogonensis]|uniref:lipocalin family protein n=1 Tax=Psychroserpens jangbogonensis TaxID=1484460 RepID=UPI00053DD1C4|nr:lipocalin family protein [Psychroserpens jangbogonensis]
MNLKKVYLVVFAFVVLSCSKDPNTFIPHLNGYWEIEEVTLSNGSKKTFTYNDTVDYIEITDSLTGFRTKLKPNLSGTYETSTDKERIDVKIENDSLHLMYSTPYANWKETVLNANKNQLLIINTNKDMYLYRRYEPFNLE